MDDETGWNEVLVDGWGELVRAAVCDRVDAAMDRARGVLALAVTAPDDAPAVAVERVHAAVLAAIAAETGADLDRLGSQAAWATYDDVWGELGRRWRSEPALERVPDDREPELLALLAQLPPSAVEHTGAVPADGHIHLVRSSGGLLLDLEGAFRWLATTEDDDPSARAAARAVVALARGADGR